MRYRKLSPTGDYEFGGGSLNFYTDTPDAVGQAVKTRILLWLGEWYLDIEEGTLYMQGIIGKHPKTTADTTLQERILTTQGMTAISDYTSVINPETRRFSVSVTLDTIYGRTALEVANYANF